MTEGSPKKVPGRSRESRAAVSKGVLGKVISEIMNQDKVPGIVQNEYDPSNPEELIRTEIFLYYVAHNYEPYPREPLLSFSEIAERTIPDSHHLSEKVAKEAISFVGREMLREMLTMHAIDSSRGNPLSEDQKIEIEEEVELFHLQRRALMYLKDAVENPERFQMLSKRGRESQPDNHVWTPEQNKRLEELKNSILWPEGTISAGKTNWREVARILREEFDVPFDRQQVQRVDEKRRRTARKKSQQ